MAYKRRIRKDSTALRGLYNKAHKTFQDPSETEKKGWMKQWVVNTILGRYGDR